MNTQTRASLKADYEQKLAHLEASEKVGALLPLPAQFIYIHGGFAAVTYHMASHPSHYSLVAAAKILVRFIRSGFTPVEIEHWAGSALSVRPRAVNPEATQSGSNMVGRSLFALKLNAGYGYSSHELQLWGKFSEGPLIQVSVRVEVDPAWLPDIAENKPRLQRPFAIPIGADKSQVFWAPERSYHNVYYWNDIESWTTWLLNQKTK